YEPGEELTVPLQKFRKIPKISQVQGRFLILEGSASAPERVGCWRCKSAVLRHRSASPHGSFASSQPPSCRLDLTSRIAHAHDSNLPLAHDDPLARRYLLRDPAAGRLELLRGPRE